MRGEGDDANEEEEEEEEGDEVVLKGKANETVEKRKEGVITAEAQSVNRLPDWDSFAQENCTLDCTFSSNSCARFPDRGLQSNVCVLFLFFHSGVCHLALRL